MYECFVFFFVASYFSWISKTWQYIQIPTVGFGLIGSFLIIFTQPESPRFLVSSGQYDKAREVLNKIAKMNGKSDTIADEWVFP